MTERKANASRLMSFYHAWQGCIAFFGREPNAKIHCVAGCVVCALAFWLRITRLEWCVIALTIGFVLCAEAANTALEALADRVTTEHDEAIKLAKDLSAAAVLIAAATSVIVGVLVFGPRVVDKFSNW